MRDKKIGIIGGMGPLATGLLFEKIVRATPAINDQDHFRIIVDNNPKIPDRTSAILKNGPSPLPELIETGKTLQLACVDVAGLPCITAHYYIDDLQKYFTYKILNALEELKKEIDISFSNIDKVGVLSTTGSIQSGLYNRYLSPLNILYPNEVDQENKVMAAIYGKDGLKAGNMGFKPAKLLKDAGDKLIENGAEIIILGCTDLSSINYNDLFPVPALDTLDILAKALVNYRVD